MTWSLAAASHLLGRTLRLPQPRLEQVARRTWQVAPAQLAKIPPTYHLPNQIERITGTVFTGTNFRAELRGGVAVEHAATRAYLLEDAWLLNGSVYCAGLRHHVQPNAARFPRFWSTREIEFGAMYCTYAGNRYFGSWLIDDCPTYALAEAEGTPVTTDHRASGHIKTYSDWLDIRPTRLDSAFFRQLIVFDDGGQNHHKRQRARALVDKLRGRVNLAETSPGVMLLRGRDGERRVLRNEEQLAERLRVRRGFTILDPLNVDLATIAAAVACARVAIGVEGSQLAHAVMFMAPETSLLTLQPASRFCTVFRDICNRHELHFGFVVGRSEGSDFEVDVDEVEQTLDLLPTR